MAVKRTSGVSPIISSLDRRVKGVESGQTTLNAQYANAITVTVSDDDDPNLDGPDTTSGVDKKYEYKRVLKAYIYGDKVTGFGSRCELYFGEDPQIAAADPVDVQGINGTSTESFNLSPKQFKAYSVDSSPWTGRQSWRNTPTTGNNGDTITNTVWFNPVVEVPSSYSRTSGVQLITTRLIDTVDIDGSTVTVNLNSTHKFELGDIISVDLPAPAFGIDGLFRISDVPDTSTIVYELDTPISGTLTLDSGDFTGGEAYVYPVARRYVKDGEVWVDKSVEPNRVWVWNVLRWYDTAEPIGDVAAVKDGIAPSPVTSLTATSTTIPGVNGQGGTAEISVSWTAPTTRSNGDPIANYLGYYEIQYKRSTETNWTGKLEVAGNLTSAVIRDPFIRLLTQYDIRVYVYDIMEQPSDPTSTTVTTTNFSETLNAPSKPILTTRLGTITVTWDGLDSTGNSPVQGVRFVEVHYSTTNNFTPGPTTLYTTFPITLQSNYAVVSDLDYNTNYYFKLRFVRSDGYSNETSAASAQETAQVAPLVDTDIINSTLSTWPFNGGVVPANALASGAINASNMFGANVVVQNAIAANAIGANQIAAGSIIAGKIAANAITASEIAANTISAGMLKANSIEADKIAAGAITASIINSKQIELKETLTSTQRIVLNASGITAYNGSDTTFFINGQTGTINAASVDVQNIKAGNITTGFLSADRIDANTITADKLSTTLTVSNLIRTAEPPNNRIEIRGENVANPGIVHISGGAPGNFRFYSNGVSFLNNLELANASLSGTLTATGTISGGTVSGATISGGTVSGSTVVGSTIRTVPAGDTSKRIIINTQGEIVFFNSGSSSEAGRLEAVAAGISVNGGSGGTLAVSGTPVISWNSSGISLLQSTTQTGSLSASGTVSSNGGFSNGTGTTIGASVSTNGGVVANGTMSIGGTSTLTGTATFEAGIRRLQLNDGTTTTATFNSTGFLIRTSSSERYKQDINNLAIPYSSILSLEPKTYRRKEEVEEFGDVAKYYAGFIAEELAGTDLDVFVFYSKDEDGNLRPEGIHYEQLSAALIVAIKEQDSRLNALEARLAALEGNG